MNELEKPGKCPVCEDPDTDSYNDTKYDLFGDKVVKYSAVRCNECNFKIRSCILKANELIYIWNRLSLSPVAPVPPAVGVEADGGAGNGEEVDS